MRLIDADAFKKYILSALEDMRHLYKDNGELAEVVTEGFCEDIDEQPTVELPQWIPCSERLPEKSGQYYVSGGGKVWVCEFLIIPNFAGGWCNNIANPVVKAWMPLPEPYKPDDFSQHMNPPVED